MKNVCKIEFAARTVAYLGCPVIMGGKGDYFVDILGKVWKTKQTYLDCSGLVTWTYMATGGKDLRDTHNAQVLSDRCPLDIVEPEPGDLGFYGSDIQHVNHVVVFLAGAHIISADGATNSRRTFSDLKAAEADLRCRVRFHSSVLYRRDEPFLGWRRNGLFTGVQDGQKE